MKITIGISGAYGTSLAKRAIECLCQNHELFVVASDCGAETFKQECKTALYDFLRRKRNITRFNNNEVLASLSSGIISDCMLILPCSSSTVGRIATDSGNTLLTRTANLTLKHRKPLVIGLQESPLGAITLRNLETLSLLGATIFPLQIPFGQEFGNIEQLYDKILKEILMSIGIENEF